jgi:hypothetical protein
MSNRSILIAVGASSALLAAIPLACGGNGAKTGFSSTTRDAAVDQIAGGDGAGGVAPGPGQPAGVGTAEAGSAPIPTSGAATAFVRLAVWTPDAPAGGYDVCLMTTGNGSAWMGPLLGNALTFPSIGRYAPVAPGSYNIGIMAGGAGCGAPVNGVIPLGMIPANARATIAMVGDLTPTGTDQAAKVVVFPDDVIGPTSQAAVRFIDALPGAQNVIIGTGSVTNFSFSPLTGSIPFGGVSSSPADGGAADSFGYLLLPPVVGAALSAHVPQGETDISTSTSFSSGGFNTGANPGILSSADDLATGTGASWGAGTAVTVALIRSSGGGAQFVVCQDDAPPMAALSACSALSK